MKHIDDWLDTPAKNKEEIIAKIFLEHCRRPANKKDEKWIENNPLFCIYEGIKYRCIGASRLGDVWLTSNFDKAYGYEKRVDVEMCSEWSNTK